VPKVYCTVNNCHYWTKGNACIASEVLVASDNFGAEQPDWVDATMAHGLGPTPVGTCMDSCCKTFVKQGSGDVRLDGVQKQQSEKGQ